MTVDNTFFKDEGDSLRVQRDQLSKLANAGGEISAGLDRAKTAGEEMASELSDMIAEAERMCKERGIGGSTLGGGDMDDLDALLADIKLEDGEKRAVENISAEAVHKVEASENWEEYLSNIHEYAEANNIDLSGDPFEKLLTPAERREIVQRIEDEYKYHGVANCDKLDYTLAAVCGVICGLVDAFFVGMPGASKLGKVVDKTADKAVEKFAKFTKWCDDKHIKKLQESGAIGKAGEYQPTGVPLPGMHSAEDYKKKLLDKLRRPLTESEIAECEAKGLASSIGYLENRFRVPYDARFASDLAAAEGNVSFSPSDHHLLSLGHSCDLIGLFFSILDQFTGKTSLLVNGSIKRFDNKVARNPFHLQGTTFQSKILFGCINWFGHIMSDLAGSSGTRGHLGTRGAGVAAPFFELFQFCDFGSLDVDGDKKTLAEFTAAMYRHGYDARFAATQAIPVALNEILIRLCWSMKRHYCHKLPWKDCVPLKLSDKPELRRMLLVGHGCLCLVDVVDAAVRSWGNLMNFALHLNLVAWARFARMGYLEIRALYKKDALNIEQLESDLKAEWEVLLDESERGP